MAYVYRFLDKKGNIIYVGKTAQTLDKRMNQHFGGRGHLSSKCYSEVAKIEYQKFQTESDALIYETYYITKFAPVYNKLQQSRDIPKLELKEGEWLTHKQIKAITPLKVQDTGKWRMVAVGYIVFIIIYLLMR